ncbi:MAG: proprotein convertase P-domain-containing protein [Bacteroidota bacterium]
MKQFLLCILLLSTSLTGFSQTYTGTGGPITDDGQPNYYIINVSGLSPAIINGSHGLLAVCLDITHSYDSDMDVKLIAPDGTTVMLFSGIGGGDDNFTGTCLNDSAATMISTATAPFTGTFIPMDIMGNVNNGQNGNGNWTLKITDTYGATRIKRLSG